MKSTIFGVFMLSFLLAQGQSIKCLPAAGDNYIRCAHTDKIETFLTEPSTNGYWDFGFLKTYYAITEKFEKASTGSMTKSFPGASLVWKKNNNEEEYLFIKDGALYSLGKSVELPFSKNKRNILRYEPARRIFQTGLKKGEEIENRYTMHVVMARKDINLKLNFIPAQFDSIWLELSYTEKGEHLGEGNVSLGGNSSQVVKMEYSILQNYRVKGRRPHGRWEAYDKLFGNSLPADLSSYLRLQQYNRVDFLSPDYVGLMISYEYMNNSITRVDYQNRDVESQVAQLQYNDFGIVAHPNPSYGPVLIDLFNYPFDDYTLEVFNIVGKRVFVRSFTSKDGRMLRVDLSALKRGTYLYSIFDGNKRKMVTKRVSLIGI